MISSVRLERVHRRLLPTTAQAQSHTPASDGGGMIVGGAVALKRGQMLYREGDVPAAPYLVVAGVLRLMVNTATGKERLADLAGPGDVLATAVFDDRPNAETVIAAGSAVVAQIDVPKTLARVRGRQELAGALVRQLNRSRELADDLGLPMGARICRILARMAHRLGEKVDMDGGAHAGAEWRHLPFNLTHDDVALLAGCARVTATRVLGELKDAGVLDGHRGNYTLVPSALERAADHYVYEVL